MNCCADDGKCQQGQDCPARCSKATPSKDSYPQLVILDDDYPIIPLAWIEALLFWGCILLIFTCFVSVVMLASHSVGGCLA